MRTAHRGQSRTPLGAKIFIEVMTRTGTRAGVSIGFSTAGWRRSWSIRPVVGRVHGHGQPGARAGELRPVLYFGAGRLAVAWRWRQPDLGSGRRDTREGRAESQRRHAGGE